MSSDPISSGYDWLEDKAKDIGGSTVGSIVLAPVTGGASLALNRVEKAKEEGERLKKDAAFAARGELKNQISGSKEIDDETRAELLASLDAGGEFESVSNLFKQALSGDANSLYKQRLSRQRYVERQQSLGQTILTTPTATNPNPGVAGNPFTTILG